MIRFFFLLSTFSLLFSASCKREGIGPVLFEVPFPVVEFGLLGGAVPAETQVISQDAIRTSFEQAMTNAGLTAEDVAFVGGLRARVVAINAEDFSEMERITLRACPVGTQNGCFDPRTQLFTVEDLFRRRQQAVDLNPTPINFKTFFLDNPQIRLELTFQSGQTTSRNIEARLEWTLAAFGAL